MFFIHIHYTDTLIHYEALVEPATSSSQTNNSKVKEEDLNDLPFAFYVRLYQVFSIISREKKQHQQLTTTTSSRRNHYHVGEEVGTKKNKSLATIYIYVYFFLEIIKFYDKTANWLLMMIRGNEESVRMRTIIVTSPARYLHLTTDYV